MITCKIEVCKEISFKIFLFLGKPVQYNMDRFWLAFTTELLRRAGGNLFKDSKTNVVYGYIDSLVNGKYILETLMNSPKSY